MKRFVCAALVAGCALIVAGCGPSYYAHRSAWHRLPDSTSAVTKQQIIAMTKAGVGDDVIIGLIRNSGTWYRLNSRDVIELADSGVTDKVIGAIIRTTEAPSDSSRGEYYSAYPYYGMYGYPYAYWYPWYPSFSFTYWGGFYHRPYYFYGNHHTGFGTYGTGRYYGRAGGGSRTMGRHR